MLETREVGGQFGIEFESSDRFDVGYTRSYELLEQPFRISSDVTIPVGGYRFQDVDVTLALGQQRPFAGGLSFQRGSFFSGTKTSVSFGGGGRFGRGRVELTPRLSLEPSLAFDWVDLPEGEFTTRLVRTRTTYTVTPLMFVSALLQYNSSNDSVSTNIRLRWEYQSGSELSLCITSNATRWHDASQTSRTEPSSSRSTDSFGSEGADREPRLCLPIVSPDARSYLPSSRR